MRDRCRWAYYCGSVTCVLGDVALTLCVSDGDGTTPPGALADLVSFLVSFGNIIYSAADPHRQQYRLAGE